ncbi:hypothetical protein WME75_15810 [Sorangium sp. So ce1014]|uniref:hypothetical protein n=1 Tax=Sorangium sp. So ce1014 TaxID=3133326 RepID=UPI003F601720
MPLDPVRATELVSQLDAAHEPRQLAASADEALNFLLTQLEQLRDLANGYPRNPISVTVWSDGRALTLVCDALTDALADRNEAARQELASRLAVGMACQVMGHYPEEIFPRVVRNARHREAIQQADDAAGSYQAVVDDFRSLDLEYTLDESEPLPESERYILEALSMALERLIALRSDPDHQLSELRQRVYARLRATPR